MEKELELVAKGNKSREVVLNECLKCMRQIFKETKERQTEIVNVFRKFMAGEQVRILPQVEEEKHEKSEERRPV